MLQIWTECDPSSYLMCPYERGPHHFLRMSLLSVTERCSKLTLYLSYCSPEISHFSNWESSLGTEI